MTTLRQFARVPCLQCGCDRTFIGITGECGHTLPLKPLTAKDLDNRSGEHRRAADRMRNARAYEKRKRLAANKLEVTT